MIAKWTTGARVIEQPANSSEAWLVNAVQSHAQKAGIAMPEVAVFNAPEPNAFATGRSPRHAAVAVTRGALALLSYDELEGVIGHELAHIKNRDTLTSTIAATIAGVLSYVGWMFMLGGRGRDVNPLFALLFVILAPFAAMLIQMAISRSREFVADHDGATIAGSPHGLIGALQKLESVARRVPMTHEMPAQNHMFIVQPLSAGQTLGKLFSTHPSTKERIARLQRMA